VEQCGTIDGWVNNAGVTVYGHVADVPPEDIERVIAVDLLGVIHGTTAVLPVLLRQGFGTIVNVGSVLSEVPMPMQASYTAAKHGVKAFTDTLRLELESAKASVRVCLVEPASTDTPFFGHARSYLGRAAAPIPPVHDPVLVARVIADCLEGARPRAVVRVGRAGTAAVLARRVAPRLVERLLTGARTAERLQRAPAPPPAVDNLYTPSPGLPSVRGTPPGSAPPDPGVP
jgi:NAD(P)-dependent dehydrogenase (short-subunit alcohol dehydrogenase family)